MWKSRSPSLFRRFIQPKFIASPPNPPALSLPSPPALFGWYTIIRRRFFSSVTEFSLNEDGISHCTVAFEKNPDWKNSQEAGPSSAELGESDTFSVAFGDGAEVPMDGLNENEIEGEDDLSSLLVESVDEDGSLGAEEVGEEVSEIFEVNIDQLENVVSILQSTLPQEIGSSLEKLKELSLTEDFVVMVFKDANVSGENLVSFFRWAVNKAAAVKSAKTLHLLIQIVIESGEIRKREAYMLWYLIKEFDKTKGILTTEMLNHLLSIFCKLGKPNGCLEVFNKFGEFGCAPDGNTYYYAIEALGKKAMTDAAWSVCEKMLSSGNLPDVEKIGKIITFFCKKKKAKDAHFVYLLAKEKNILLGRDALNFLIGGLCRNDESVYLALELLQDCLQKSLRYENNTFFLVVQSLTRIKDAKAAKSLLLRMIDFGPPPQNSAFNHVITGLCKEGEVEDAIALTKLMKSRGLRPDVYTYSVIMSGFAKAGMMDEAFKVFCEAKKKHKVLTPVTYHILIRGYCKMEEYGKALECLKDMKENGVLPNSDEYGKLINTLCLKAVDWRTAEELSGEMKERGLRLKGGVQSLIAAVKMLEEEEIAADESKIDA